MHTGEGESMKLSTKGRYGLRALIDLAQYSGGDTPVSITSISDRQAISERYLEQLMAMLKKAGFSVAMGNAVPEIKDLCDFVTKTNEEDGVAYVIEMILEGWEMDSSL